MKPPLRKRQYFLKDSCQPRIMTMNLMHQGFVWVAFSAALFVPLMLQLNKSPLGTTEAHHVADEFLALHQTIWPALPIALFLVGLHSLFFSHRIAGPIYRFRQIFTAVANGDLTVKARIRKHDYLHAEAERLQAMLDALRSKIQEIEQGAEESASAIRRLKQAIAAGSTQDAHALVVLIEAGQDRLTKGVHQFRTETALTTQGS